LIIMYAMLFIFGLRIASRAPDLFGCLLATGAATVIGLQASFNIAVNLVLVPTKGLVLPFMSAGGTALVITLALCGLLISVGKQCEDKSPAPENSPPRRRARAAA